MNLYLIGYRGCGKSTVAPLLAKRLQWQAIDTDQQIELIAGRSITDIFNEEGEAVFRQLESSIIKEIASQSNKVVSLGGGAPMVEINRQTAAASGRTVWLTASPEELWRRIASDPGTVSTRPRLTELDGLDEVKDVLRKRNDVYEACADYTINTQGLTVDQVADRIANWWIPVDKEFVSVHGTGSDAISAEDNTSKAMHFIAPIGSDPLEAGNGVPYRERLRSLFRLTSYVMHFDIRDS